MNILTNKTTPSDNPFYKYVLEEMCGGIGHKNLLKITRSQNAMDYIEWNGGNYKKRIKMDGCSRILINLLKDVEKYIVS